MTTLYVCLCIEIKKLKQQPEKVPPPHRHSLIPGGRPTNPSGSMMGGASKGNTRLAPSYMSRSVRF